MKQISDPSRREVRIVLICCLTAFLLLTAAAKFVLQDFPNSGDEFAYNFQAETLKDVRTFYPAHRLHTYFKNWRIDIVDGKVYGEYPPGWPFLLALGTLLGLPRWMINPFLGALLIAATYFLGKKLHGQKTGAAASLAMFFSSFFILNSASFFSHTACALFMVLYVLSAVKFFETGKIRYGLLAGFFMSYAFIIREYTAFACFIPLIAERRFFRKASFLVLFAGALPVLVIYLFYNHSITGSFFKLTNTPYITSFFDLFSFSLQTYTLRSFSGFFPDNLEFLSETTNMLILPLFTAHLIVSGVRRKLHFSDLIFPAMLFAYGVLLVSGGHQYGPRYFFEAYPFVLIGIFAFILGIRQRKTRIALLALFLCGGVYQQFYLTRYLKNTRDIIWERQDLFRQVDKAGLENAVVVVASPSGKTQRMSPNDLLRNDGKLENSILYAHPAIGRVLDYARIRFPGRGFYVYTVEGTDDFEGRIVKAEHYRFQKRPSIENFRLVTGATPDHARKTSEVTDQIRRDMIPRKNSGY